MAFQRDEFSNFFKLLKIVQGFHIEERSIAENLILEERLTEAREDSYAGYITSPQDLGDWEFEHEKYVSGKITLLHGQGTPETFTDLNNPNLLPQIDQDQFLVRVENLAELAKRARGDVDIAPIVDDLKKLIEDPTDHAAIDVVEEFLSDYNRNRDLRPIFVGFWGEVKDLLDENDDRWANKLRDRLGLGHYDPMEGGAIPVLLLRYRIADVVAVQPDELNFAAIPTVLDSSMSSFFCPTPQAWAEGQTLNLTPGPESDYVFNCEILHRYIKYKASYVYRFGWITESPGKTCVEARRIHLEYLKDDFKYFDQL
ncbi:MAG: hypothetical protein KKH99_14890 [Proteobacteria bacterium]|nr:hypothetical protein [Pseudomonadota bacterium]